MKFNSDSKYASIAFYSFIVISASMLFYLAIVNFSNIRSFFSSIAVIFTPITLGLIMAYLFNFFLVMYEDKLLSRYKIKKKRIRLLGLILTYLTVFILFGLFLQFILPQLISSLTGIILEIPTFVMDASQYIYNLTESLNLSDSIQSILVEKTNELISTALQFSTSLLPMLANYGLLLMSRLWNIVLGIIISVYLLADKERFVALSKKVTYSLIPQSKADKSLELLELADSIFGKFLSGKILDSAIIGVLTFVILVIFKMPYALLIAFIIGITNIIPFFGPFIGAIPAFFIILFVSVNQAFIFLILIIIIQQIDGNIIGPKILGDSLGISAFWILFSLLIGGKLFGIVGMIIGVPLFVFLYAILKEVLENRLERKSLPIETEEYMEHDQSQDY